MALVLTLLTLMLLSAIAAGLVYVTNIDSSVNLNYRSEQVAYFAAKAGIQEARDRMMPSNTNSINAILPTAAPSDSNKGVIYILNEGNNSGSVQPWNYGNNGVGANAYFDDELCHDGYNLSGLTQVASDVRCTSYPTGTNWYQTTTSTVHWSGTAAALPYKWVRIALKVNNGSPYPYPVNASGAASTLICWTGYNEVLLAATAATCSAMSPTLPPTPVYELTSMAVSSTGARKLMQADVAMVPAQTAKFGMFATGKGCGAITFSGNATTDSFNSANGGTYATTHSNSNGNIGSNGNITASGNATINGTVSVLSTGSGACAQGANGAVSNGNDWTVSGNVPQPTVTPLPQMFTPTAPPLPNPLPPTNDVNYTKSTSLSPGNYGNLTLSGQATLTLSPGTYNINSITISGQGGITVSPAGQVVLNIADQPSTANGTPPQPLQLTGNSIMNPSGIANNFQINYAGSGQINIAGNDSAYFILNAPNAALQLSGNGDFYGAVLANTIVWSGNGAFHYDQAAESLLQQSSGPLNMIAYRELFY